MKRRLIAKQRGDKTWGVYDTERASWPALVPGFGAVQQIHPTEQAAQVEADRLGTRT